MLPMVTAHLVFEWNDRVISQYEHENINSKIQQQSKFFLTELAYISFLYISSVNAKTVRHPAAKIHAFLKI